MASTEKATPGARTSTRWQRRVTVMLGVGAALATVTVLLCLVISNRWQARLAPLGLRLTVTDANGRTLLERPWPLTDLSALEARGPGLPRVWSARLAGFVWIPRAARYACVAKAEGDLSLRLAGQEVLRHLATDRDARAEAEVWLARGFVPLELVVRSGDTETLARLRLAEVGERPILPAAERLYTDPATWRDQATRERVVGLRRAAGIALLWAFVLAGGALGSQRLSSGRWPTWATKVGPPLLLLLLATSLRFQALVERYWLADTPPWARGLSQVIATVTPEGLSWPSDRAPYGGDPWTYLKGARDGHGFYDANPREPVFIFVTRLVLRLVGGDNPAVDLASACFSVLAVLALYALGVLAFNRGVGFFAGLLFAVEPGVVSLAVEGWRDDAFAFFVAATAAAFVAFDQRARPRRGLLLGVLCGLACLTRITALSFILPGLAWSAWRQRRAGREAWLSLGLATLLLVAIVAPYLISCAVALGDPLRAINIHTGFYRERQGLGAQEPMGWMRFLATSRAPLATFDTLLAGLTLYPFENKWVGLRLLLGPLGNVLAGASVIGLFGFVLTRPGRLLLLLLFSSLVPFAFTWDVTGGAEWRFTLHAYGLYLVAAVWAIGIVVDSLRRQRRTEMWRRRRRIVWQGAALLGAAILLAVLLGTVHHARVRSDIARGASATVQVGLRDWMFFGRGWSLPKRSGHGVIRESDGGAASIRLPLAAAKPYHVTLWGGLVCGTGTPLRLTVTLDGSPLTRLVIPSSQAGPRRVVIEIPPGRSTSGRNTIELRPEAGLPAPCARPRSFWLKSVVVQQPRKPAAAVRGALHGRG